MIAHPDMFDAPKAPELNVESSKLLGLFFAGIFIGLVVGEALEILSRPRPARRRVTIFLPNHPVFRTCFCGYPSRNFGDLASHFEDMHPTASPELREEVLYPIRAEGSE